MKDNQPHSSNAAGLRRQAEEMLREKADQSPQDLAALSSDEILKILHELRVHQIELELQNEELRRTQFELKTARERYFNLYDLAPVGYVTLSKKGLILEANLTATGLLGVARGTLAKQPLSHFILKEDQDIYYLHRKRLFESGEAQGCDLRMLKEDGTPFWAHLAATAAQDEEGAPVCHAVISDITGRKQAEETVRESENILKDILESTLSGYWDWNIKDNTEYLSPTFKQMFGYEDHEMENSPEAWQIIIFPEDLPGVLEVFVRHVKSRGREPYYNEVRYRHKDGSTVWVICAGRVIKWSADGSPTRMVGCHINITDRKQAEEMLRESEEKYKSLHESAGVGIGYYSLDGKVISYNLLAARHMGGNPEEFTGKSVYELFPSSNAEVYMDRIRTAAASNEIQEYEDKVELPGGAKWFVSLFTRILNSSNQVIGVQIISSDISKNKQMEDALKEDRQRLDSIIKGTNTGTWEWNVQTGETIFNDRWAEIIGYTLDEISPVSIETWMKYAHPDDLKVSGELLERHFRGELDYYEFESRMKHKDGSWVWILDRGKVTSWTQDGKPLMMMGTHQDITERKRAEEILRDSEAQKHAILNGLTTNIALVDKELNILWANKAAAESLNARPDDMIGNPCFSFWGDSARPCANCPTLKAFQTGQSEHIIVQTPDGRIWDEGGEPVFDADGNVNTVVMFAQDITERKRAENDLKAAYSKLEALWSITSLEEADLNSISDHILITITRMTDSTYGFYGFVNEEEPVMTIHSWSGEAMKDCSMIDKPQHFPIGDAGIWAEAIRRREPFILNDYNIDQPAKNGLPVGHVPLNNLLVVPYLSHGRIVSVAAVANRLNDYTQDDVSQITTFLTSIEAIIDNKKSEESLRESELKFRQTFDISPVGIVMVGLDRRFIHCNLAFAQALGYETEELVGKLIADVTLPEDSQIGMADMVAVLKGEIGKSQVQKRYIRKDGQVIWGEVTISLIRDTNGHAQYFLAIIQNITERKQAEERLMISEQHFRSLFEQTASGVAITDAHSGKFLKINQAFCDILGYTPEEMQNVEFKTLTHPDDVKISLDKMDLLLKGAIAKFSMEKRYIRKNGSVVWVVLSVASMWETGDSPTNYVSIVQDITTRKEIEQALRESEERYHLIDEASQDLIYSYDRQSRFTHANSSLCKLMGLKPEQIIGKTHEELGFPQEQCDEWARLHQQVLETNSTVISETVTPIQGGEPLYFEVVLNPIHDDIGAIIGIAGVTRDINARKLAEAKISEQLNELRRWNNATLGREDRIMELKREVNKLLAEAGKPPHYASVAELQGSRGE